MIAPKELDKAEFKQMCELIRRYSEYNMDQWELWKFNTKYSEVFVSIGRQPSCPGTADAHSNINAVFEE